jgi:phosphatidate cytidylyltransferase
MLRQRLVVGTLLILWALAVLGLDPAPYFPILLCFAVVVLLALTFELHHLLSVELRPNLTLLLGGTLLLVLVNWAKPLGLPGDPLAWLCGAMIVNLMLAFLNEARTYREPGLVTRRLALTFFAWGYIGLLGSFLVQLRWYNAAAGTGPSTTALLLAIFVPKMCDTGAYFTGRLIGKHKMTPVLSPKKTWEGAAGGLVLAALTSVFITHLVGRQWVFEPSRYADFPLCRDILLGIPGWAWSLLFGVVIGLVGMIGDLMESLLKRDLGQKDASSVVPGFGGLLDVFDAILFSAPVTFGILHWLSWSAGMM